ncbi:GNAT family N-acetyltransferase [Antrihabitans cavernicola]|uniref:GNAT family N-acetyltransferase n=1 Tax=Antrihabitans cavernicola TaxID=2495913 RepID=A0A5A7SAN9_9NOCA|nr:GNAT family protein [Spelaeibacter cavernicola]KAA0021585.1 GNAT family N-acetyltransferase [Spelaeibacter cavernicola]
MRRSAKSPLLGLIAKNTTLGPVDVNGRTVLLRPPRISDGADWRRIRLRDREFNEAAAPTSTLDWDERHNHDHWARNYMMLKRAQREGRRVPFAVEIDGRFAGESALTWAEVGSGSAELALWLDTTVVRGGLSTVVTGLIADYAFTTLGLPVVTGSTATENKAGNALALALGMHPEATMASFFDAGGRRKAYNWYTLTTDDIPDGGFAARAVERARPHSAQAQDSSTDKAWGSRVPASIKIGAYAAKYAVVSTVQQQLQRVRRAPTVNRGPKTVAAGVVTLRSRRKSDAAPIAEWMRGVEVDPELPFAIDLNGTLVGQAWLRQIYNLTAELGVVVDPRTATPELTTAAAELMLNYAFEVGCERVWIPVLVADDDTRNLAEQLGLTNEGTLTQFRPVGGVRKDHELWAITPNITGQ